MHTIFIELLNFSYLRFLQPFCPVKLLTFEISNLVYISKNYLRRLKRPRCRSSNNVSPFVAHFTVNHDPLELPMI